MSEMRLALLQIDILPGQIEAHLEQLLQGYNQVEADLVVAPELALTGYASPPLERERAALARLERAVEEKGVPLIVGTRMQGEKGLLNVAMYLPGQKVVAQKVHLFPGLDDLWGFSSGEPLSPFDLLGWRAGVFICFDLRFPEISRSLAYQGAEILFVLAQWPAERVAHFEALLRARALENQCFVVGVNASGQASGLRLGGHSAVFSPQGELLAQAGEGAQVLTVTLAQESLEKARKIFCSVRPALPTPPERKVLGLSTLLVEVTSRRHLGQKMVFTNGCFDLLHAGHVDYLYEARAQGDFLVVGLNSDASLRRLKGPSRPLNPQEYRARVLAALACVDYVVIFEEDTPERLIEALRPDVLVKGADWPEEKIVGAALVKSYGGKVVRIPFRYQISTTKIMQRILAHQKPSEG